MLFLKVRFLQNVKKVLSAYDLLGILSPTMITLEMLFHKICMMKINWDNVLPETIIAKLENILENVNAMSSLKLETHYLKVFDLKDVEVIKLHGFSDASLKGYAAIIYIRSKLKDGSCCFNFPASKTKINPIERKDLTIPKLELMACALLNQLIIKT